MILLEIPKNTQIEHAIKTAILLLPQFQYKTPLMDVTTKLSLIN